MEFKENYFESGNKFNKNKGLYSLKNIFPFKKIVEKKSAEHWNLLLEMKWKYLKECSTVLDVGCGRCQFIKFNPYHIEVFGVDIIKEEVKKARENGLNVKVGDLKKRLPFKDSSFDGVSGFHVLEHLEEGTHAVSEFKRILKNKGILILAVPSSSFKKFYKDYTHKRYYPKEALFRLLNDNGFYEIKVLNGCCSVPIVSAIFLFFPRIRLAIEKILGKIKPFEIIAVAKNRK